MRINLSLSFQQGRIWIWLRERRISYAFPIEACEPKPLTSTGLYQPQKESVITGTTSLVEGRYSVVGEECLDGELVLGSGQFGFTASASWLFSLSKAA